MGNEWFFNLIVTRIGQNIKILLIIHETEYINRKDNKTKNEQNNFNHHIFDWNKCYLGGQLKYISIKGSNFFMESTAVNFIILTAKSHTLSVKKSRSKVTKFLASY